MGRRHPRAILVAVICGLGALSSSVAQSQTAGSDPTHPASRAAPTAPRVYFGVSLLGWTNHEADTTGHLTGHGGFIGAVGGTVVAGSLVAGGFVSRGLSLEAAFAVSATQTGSAEETWQRVDRWRIDDTYLRQEDLISLGVRWHMRSAGRRLQIEPVASMHWALVQNHLTNRIYHYEGYGHVLNERRPDVSFTSGGIGVGGGVDLSVPVSKTLALAGGMRVRVMKWEDADVPETIWGTVPSPIGPVVIEFGVGLRWTWPATR